MLPGIALPYKRSFDGPRRLSTKLHTAQFPILGLDLNDGLGLEKERRIKSDALSVWLLPGRGIRGGSFSAR